MVLLVVGVGGSHWEGANGAFWGSCSICSLVFVSVTPVCSVCKNSPCTFPYIYSTLLYCNIFCLCVYLLNLKLLFTKTGHTHLFSPMHSNLLAQPFHHLLRMLYLSSMKYICTWSVYLIILLI